MFAAFFTMLTLKIQPISSAPSSTSGYRKNPGRKTSGVPLTRRGENVRQETCLGRNVLHPFHLFDTV